MCIMQVRDSISGERLFSCVITLDASEDASANAHGKSIILQILKNTYGCIKVVDDATIFNMMKH